MHIIPEIELSESQHREITELRNGCFPEYAVQRSYYKQLPHYRALVYEENSLVGYMGLDYRVVSIDSEPYKILGVIDFCVAPKKQGNGLGSEMLSTLISYAEEKSIDFIMLVAELPNIYMKHGFIPYEMTSSWLRIDEHTNYGVAVEKVQGIYIKQTGSTTWSPGHLDWLGYMF